MVHKLGRLGTSWQHGMLFTPDLVRRIGASAIAKQGTNFGVQSPAATSTNTLLFDLPHTKAFSWKRNSQQNIESSS